MLTCIFKAANLSNDSRAVRKKSNLLVANVYWMVAFKRHVFDTSLFEEMPSKSNSEIWKLFLS